MARIARAQRFVGRQPQLALLKQRLEEASGGAGNVVLVAGEAGAGKSRLLSEFASALPPNARYVVGQCLEYVQSPFAPFLAAYAALVDKDPAAQPASSNIRAVLATLAPEPQAGTSESQRHSDRLGQFTAMTDALKRYAVERPVVIAIEDAHWADGASVELLQHLAARMTTSRVLIIATLRAEELKRSHTLRSTIAKLARLPSVQRIDLEPMSEVETHELVYYALEGHAPLPPATVGAICAQSEGNPLFAEELLNTVIESGDVEPGRRLPDTLREAVLDRCAVLEENEREILTQAAIIGRRFQPDFLSRIAARPADEVLAALKHAIELSLLVEESNGEVQFAFTHELTRRAIYGELLTAQARLLHSKIASALESSPGQHTAELAYHWGHARELEKAARYNELAADAALSVFAYHDAVVNLERALAAGRTDATHRATLYLKLAKALHQNGLDERALAAARSALEHFEEIGDHKSVAATLLELALWSAAAGDTHEAFDLTRRALEMIGDDTSNPSYFEAHVEMLRLYVQSRWEPKRAQEHLDLLERIPGDRRAADRIALQYPLSTFLAATGRPPDALAVTEEAAELAMRAGHAREAARAWGTFAVDMLCVGESKLAHDALERSMTILREQKIAGLTAEWIPVLFAWALQREGTLEAARTIILDALAADIESTNFRMLVALIGIPVALQLNDDDLVRRCAQPELVEHALESSLVWFVATMWVFAEDHYAHGRQQEAEELLRKALDAFERMDAKPLGEADDLFLAVARYGNAQDIARARRMLEEIERSSKVRFTPAQLTLFDAFAAHRTGDTTGAEQKARQAGEMFAQIGWPWYQAQAMEMQGLDEAALDIYRRIGDVPDARRLDAKLNPVNRRGRAKGDLTAREREICDLLTKGRTNKAIADQLVVSERTVESHVSSILTKMGAASRAELIAKLKP